MMRDFWDTVYFLLMLITFCLEFRSEYAKFICMNETKAEKKLWHSFNGKIWYAFMYR